MFQLSASLNLKKSLFGGATKKHLEAPFLYHWLGKLQDALVSKVIFYDCHDIFFLVWRVLFSLLLR